PGASEGAVETHLPHRDDRDGFHRLAGRDPPILHARSFRERSVRLAGGHHWSTGRLSDFPPPAPAAPSAGKQEGVRRAESPDLNLPAQRLNTAPRRPADSFICSNLLCPIPKKSASSPRPRWRMSPVAMTSSASRSTRRVTKSSSVIVIN